MNDRSSGDVVIIGGGFAGLSAGIYLGRSRRRVLVIEWGKSMAVWEPDVQNYLGFPEGISGEDLLAKGRAQALKPALKVVFMSGYTANLLEEKGLGAAKGRFLQKPFVPAELARLVRAALDDRETP